MATNHLTLQGICSVLFSLPISMKCLVHFYFLSFSFFFYCELPFDLNFFHRWSTLFLSKEQIALFNIKVSKRFPYASLSIWLFSILQLPLISFQSPIVPFNLLFQSLVCWTQSSLSPACSQAALSCFFLRSLTPLLSGPGEPWGPSSSSSSTNLLSSSSFSSASASASLKSVSDSSEFSSSRYR